MRRAASLLVCLCAAVDALQTVPRRAMLAAPVCAPFVVPMVANAEGLPTDKKDLLALVTEARRQLDPVPNLISDGKWDSVRAILIKPPLYDCWGKNAKPLLKNYAAAIGDANGDELAALEAREEAQSHLAYLDMAVYNNVFSPAGGDAKVSASKDLVKQYYEMPTAELAASTSALDELVKLGGLK